MRERAETGPKGRHGLAAPLGPWVTASLLLHATLLLLLARAERSPDPAEGLWRVVGEAERPTSRRVQMVAYRGQPVISTGQPAAPPPSAAALARPPASAAVQGGRVQMPRPPRAVVPEAGAKRLPRAAAVTAEVPLVVNTPPRAVAAVPPSPSETAVTARPTETPPTAGPRENAPLPAPSAQPSVSPTPLVAPSNPGEARMPPLRAAVPVATSPGVGSPTPLTSPAPPLFVLDPQVDFTLVLGYLNDPRIPRDRKGCYVIDLEALSRMDGVRPVLAEVPRAPLSLADAASCGLRPGAVVHATVQVTIRAGELPTLVCPTAVQLLDATLDGAELPRTCRDAIIGHVVDRVATTRWLPASDRGRLCESAQQAFEVWLVQARDENLAAASRSQVP